MKRQGFLNCWLHMITTYKYKSQNITEMNSYMHTKEEKGAT